MNEIDGTLSEIILKSITVKITLGFGNLYLSKIFIEIHQIHWDELGVS